MAASEALYQDTTVLAEIEVVFEDIIRQAAADHGAGQPSST